MERSEHASLHGSKAVFTFVQPTEKLKITYREQQNRLRMAVARHKDLQDGCLLDTLEKGGQLSEGVVFQISRVQRVYVRIDVFLHVGSGSENSATREASLSLGTVPEACLSRPRSMV